jgi:hypothetical protein
MREASYTSFRLGLYKPLKQLFKADKPDAESGDLDYLRTDFDRESTKKLFIDVSCRPDSPFILKFAAGGASGGLGSVVGNPFDILKTKMMASETGLGLAETAGSIFANQGVLGFYRGIDANIARAVVNNGTKMACYDQSKGLLQEHVGLSGIGLQAAASFVAGFFMTCTVAPFDICRTRLMNQRRHRVARWGGVSRQKSIGVLFPGYCSESSRADRCERLGRRAPRETMFFVEISRITDWGPLRAPPGSRPPWGGISRQNNSVAVTSTDYSKSSASDLDRRPFPEKSSISSKIADATLVSRFQRMDFWISRRPAGRRTGPRSTTTSRTPS